MFDMFGTLTSIIQVIIGFGALIFVHELGHFLVAKWAGVRVEEFALGFGPYLFTWKRGHTTYAIRIVPLGGFVQMRGQNDLDVGAGEDRAPDSYVNKSVPKRMAIIVAGVTMNAIFAVFLLVMAFWLWGVPYVPPVVDAPPPRSSAALAQCVAASEGDCEDVPPGIQRGDRVLSVDGQKVGRHQDIRMLVALAPNTGNPVRVRVQRGEGEDARELTFLVKPKQEDVPGARGVQLASLRLNPMQVERELPIGLDVDSALRVAAVLPSSPAELAGLQKGDLILAVDGKRDIDRINHLVNEAGEQGRPVELLIRRQGEQKRVTVRPSLPLNELALNALARGRQALPQRDAATVEGTEEAPAGQSQYLMGIGLEQREVVKSVDPGGPAAKAGVKPGDILALELPPPYVSLEDVEAVTVYRVADGQPGPALQVPLKPGASALHFEQQIKARKQHGLLGAIPAAFDETGNLLRTTYRTLYSLVRGDVPLKGMSGPVGIMQMTYTSSKPGFGMFLWFLALISINLAVINLLPIPILDGGHLIFLAIEGVRRKPLSRRVQELALWSGLVLLLTVFLYATWNDLTRLLT